MAVVGWIAVILVALLVVFALVMVATSLPDLRRYRRIRNM